MIHKAAGLSYDEWRAELVAMAKRNRVALDRARAEGADTWVCEEFRRGDDGVLHQATKQVPVPPADPGTPDPRGYLGTSRRDSSGRLRRPWAMYEDDEGNISYGRDAIAAPLGSRRPGRAPRRATNARRRGSRRTTTAARAGPEDDPEPPGARPCACGCGRPRPEEAGQYYALDECRKRHARERKRRQRSRDREEGTERHVARRVEAGDRPPQPGRCKPGCEGEAVYVDPEGAVVCVACGKPRTVTLRRVNGYDAWFRDRAAMMASNGVFVHKPQPRREWKTRPTRSEAAKLRRTRRDRKAVV